MKFLKIFLSFIVCTLFLFPVTALAEEETSSISEYDSYDDYILENSATFLSDVATVASSFDNSHACINFLELSYAQRQAIINLNHSGNNNNLVILSSSGAVFTFNGGWFEVSDLVNGDSVRVYTNTNVTNRGVYKINTDGSIVASGTSYNGVIKSVFYWVQNSGGSDPLGLITFDGSLCSVGPIPTSTPFPSDDPFACNFALNEVISNDYIASLVAYAEKQNYTEPYYIYRVYYSDSAEDMNILSNSGVYSELQPFSIKGYVLALEGYAYPQTYVLEYKQLRKLCTESACAFAEFDLLDSMMYPFYELVLSSTCLERGDFSEIQATQDVNSSIQQTITQNATSISNQNTMINQNQQIIDSSNKTNDLVENGNSISQNKSDQLETNSSSLISDMENLSQFESEFSSVLNEGVPSLYSTAPSLDSPHLLTSASLLGQIVEGIVVETPLNTLVFFSLFLGFSLFLLGRLR